MQHRKTILFTIIIASALCLISCGKDTKKSLSSSQNTEAQTTVDITDTNINNTTDVSDYDSQGKRSSSRTMASGIGMEFFCNESPLPDMVYGHICDNSEFGNYFFSIHKSLDEDVEYIAFVNEEGFAEDVLCWICSYDKKYVGIAKKYDSNLKDDFENWDDVLSYFDLKEGEYTNIYSDETN